MAMNSSLAWNVKHEGGNFKILAIPVGRITDAAHSKEFASFFTPIAGTMARGCMDRVGCGRQVAVRYIDHAKPKHWSLTSIKFEISAISSMKVGKENGEKKYIFELGFKGGEGLQDKLESLCTP